MDPQKLIEKAKAGNKLRKSQRIRAIRHLLNQKEVSTSQLAETFNTSVRTIERDRVQIRQEISSEILDSYGLLGLLKFEYKRNLRKLNEIIEDSDDMNLQRLCINNRWKLVTDFFDRTKDREIESRIETLEKAVLEN